ncbi:hypothetical protein [Candidatus Kryptobacter tengchongensis]|uniref:Fibronectin type-III domain-containing protein n=1 Tax=Kryptobacter tengchongensis TaxID=1643429 RepID=A0A656D7A6_KRYT1|nr:hypothetical protein [Candidatus Kryptobacter tengchongensis]CUT01218.1 hypothetical protein JGI24_00903 [Candidatus Kryptobacter tengchongensis]
MRLKIQIIFLLIALFFSCSPTRESLPVPDKPKIYPVPDPLDESDIGSGAIPEVNGIKIIWSKVANSSGYKIYRGEMRGDKVEFKFYYDVRAQAGIADTFFIDINVEVRKVYYYYVRAYNRDNVESQPSDTIFFELYHKPRLLSPGNNSQVSADTLIFRWDDPNGGGDFVIRVKNAQTDSIVWIYRYRSFSDFWVKFNIDSRARENLVSGRQYKWRVDRVQFGQNAGSKSNWGVFNVK